MIQKSSKKGPFFSLQEARLAGKLAKKDQTGFSSPSGLHKTSAHESIVGKFTSFDLQLVDGLTVHLIIQSVSCTLFIITNRKKEEAFPNCCHNIQLRTFCSELHRPEAHKHGLLIPKLTRQTPITRMSSGF